ncbi:unnamed protein product [Vitrella brassicaformis CCMP3155]|uniref:Vesicle tethering protein Uso1/P115-like head domain-containing protein n=1 Tax=Vitrella brassicaformis (strain CCMP3155) TaxID=1169540 RepID=A0A0G4EF88_VITBC|nr:unnamed protein product [Vitrella brassicaformis CCMP3155]|eukprot:CEL94636.1 unnamed protein product [Vitrella brassicaformis CCMP3155]
MELLPVLLTGALLTLRPVDASGDAPVEQDLIESLIGFGLRREAAQKLHSKTITGLDPSTRKDVISAVVKLLSSSDVRAATLVLALDKLVPVTFHTSFDELIGVGGLRPIVALLGHTAPQVAKAALSLLLQYTVLFDSALVPEEKRAGVIKQLVDEGQLLRSLTMLLATMSQNSPDEKWQRDVKDAVHVIGNCIEAGGAMVIEKIIAANLVPQLRALDRRIARDTSMDKPAADELHVLLGWTSRSLLGTPIGNDTQVLYMVEQGCIESVYRALDAMDFSSVDTSLLTFARLLMVEETSEAGKAIIQRMSKDAFEDAIRRVADDPDENIQEHAGVVLALRKLRADPTMSDTLSEIRSSVKNNKGFTSKLAELHDVKELMLDFKRPGLQLEAIRALLNVAFTGIDGVRALLRIDVIPGLAAFLKRTVGASRELQGSHVDAIVPALDTLMLIFNVTEHHDGFDELLSHGVVPLLVQALKGSERVRVKEILSAMGAIANILRSTSANAEDLREVQLQLREGDFLTECERILSPPFTHDCLLYHNTLTAFQHFLVSVNAASLSAQEQHAYMEEIFGAGIVGHLMRLADDPKSASCSRDLDVIKFVISLVTEASSHQLSLLVDHGVLPLLCRSLGSGHVSAVVAGYTFEGLFRYVEWGTEERSTRIKQLVEEEGCVRAMVNHAVGTNVVYEFADVTISTREMYASLLSTLSIDRATWHLYLQGNSSENRTAKQTYTGSSNSIAPSQSTGFLVALVCVGVVLYWSFVALVCVAPVLLLLYNTDPPVLRRFQSWWADAEAMRLRRREEEARQVADELVAEEAATRARTPTAAGGKQRQRSDRHLTTPSFPLAQAAPPNASYSAAAAPIPTTTSERDNVSDRADAGGAADETRLDEEATHAALATARLVSRGRKKKGKKAASWKAEPSASSASPQEAVSASSSSASPASPLDDSTSGGPDGSGGDAHEREEGETKTDEISVGSHVSRDIIRSISLSAKSLSASSAGGPACSPEPANPSHEDRHDKKDAAEKEPPAPLCLVQEHAPSPQPQPPAAHHTHEAPKESGTTTTFKAPQADTRRRHWGASLPFIQPAGAISQPVPVPPQQSLAQSGPSGASVGTHDSTWGEMEAAWTEWEREPSGGHQGDGGEDTGAVTRRAAEEQAAKVVAQLQSDVRDAIANKHRLESQNAALLQHCCSLQERTKQLSEAFDTLKSSVPLELTRDALFALKTSAEVRAFETRIREEDQRLDTLYDMAMGAKALPPGQPLPLPDNSPLLNQGATAFSLTQPPAAGPSPVHSQQALPSTEAELRQMHHKLNVTLRELEEAIATVSVECRSLEAVLQPLQREYTAMRNQTATGWVDSGSFALVKTAAAIEAFKQDIKHAQKALRDLSHEAGKQVALLEGVPQQQQPPPATSNGNAAVERGSCVACRDDTHPPVITFRAKAEKERLEGAGRPVPEVRRYAVLRCPACGMDAVHADSLSDVRVTTD